MTGCPDTGPKARPATSSGQSRIIPDRVGKV